MQVEQNYTVILGSHRNSRLKIEKDGEERCLVENVPGSKVTGQEFTSYWVNLTDGVISVGTGETDATGAAAGLHVRALICLLVMVVLCHRRLRCTAAAYVNGGLMAVGSAVL